MIDEELPSVGSCAHCWHWTGTMLPSLPPQTGRVCCWCGKREFVRAGARVPIDAHGEYLPWRRYR